jgi:hypothetical protein
MTLEIGVSLHLKHNLAKEYYHLHMYFRRIRIDVTERYYKYKVVLHNVWKQESVRVYIQKTYL